MGAVFQLLPSSAKNLAPLKQKRPSSQLPNREIQTAFLLFCESLSGFRDALGGGAVESSAVGRGGRRHALLGGSSLGRAFN